VCVAQVAQYISRRCDPTQHPLRFLRALSVLIHIYGHMVVGVHTAISCTSCRCSSVHTYRHTPTTPQHTCRVPLTLPRPHTLLLPLRLSIPRDVRMYGPFVLVRVGDQGERLLLQGERNMPSTWHLAHVALADMKSAEQDATEYSPSYLLSQS